MQLMVSIHNLLFIPFSFFKGPRRCLALKLPVSMALARLQETFQLAPQFVSFPAVVMLNPRSARVLEKFPAAITSLSLFTRATFVRQHFPTREAGSVTLGAEK